MSGDRLPKISVVVIAYEMAAQLQRTLWSLSPSAQRGVEADDYEVIVIDNGSREPLPIDGVAGFGPGQLSGETIEDAKPSPAAAINRGLELARGDLVGVMIDGARIASPGILARALAAAGLDARPVVTTLGFHLGPDLQARSIREGYDEEQESQLLRRVAWEDDPYRLFEISVPAASAADGWFSTPAESNALFLPAEMWNELGGFDEEFESPGGGLVNLDTFKRACELPGSRPVILLGEGTFHQVHGGVATNSPTSRYPEFHAEYQRLRGAPFSRPEIEPLYLGSLTPSARAAMTRGRAREEVDAPAADPERDEYLELLKRALINEIGLAGEAAFFSARDALEETRSALELLSEGAGSVEMPEPFDDRRMYDVRGNLPDLHAELLEARSNGRYFRREPRNIGFGFSMIGRARLDSLQACVIDVLDQGVGGDLVECGVWRGGAAILMRAILGSRGDRTRTVWLADSFAGLPAPTAPQDTYDLSADVRPELAVPLETVKGNFELFGLLDERVRFLPGWFSDTLPTAPISQIAVLRLDGDMYSSTVESLESLYDRVSPGGFVIIDDYGVVTGCRTAVDEFREMRGVAAPLIEVDHTCVFWRKD